MSYLVKGSSKLDTIWLSIYNISLFYIYIPEKAHDESHQARRKRDKKIPKKFFKR